MRTSPNFTPTKAQIDKLPKWAQDLITRQQRQVEDAERLAEEARLSTNPDTSNTVINPYVDTIGLPNGEHVRFKLPGNPIESWIDVHVSGDHIELQAGTRLVIYGQASNVMYAKVETRG